MDYESTGTISFKTLGDWTVLELADFTYTVDGLFFQMWALAEGLPPLDGKQLRNAVAELDYKFPAGKRLFGIVKTRYSVIGPEHRIPVRARESFQVDRLDVASPGLISFKGLGEPIRELRNLIKDFWYVNRQAKEKGDLELELLRQQLAKRIPIEVRLPDDVAEHSVQQLQGGLRTLKNFEDRKLLDKVDDFID
jgi:hypothetical protein